MEHFRQVGWLPPNYKLKTLQGIAVVERYWRRWVNFLRLVRIFTDRSDGIRHCEQPKRGLFVTVNRPRFGGDSRARTLQLGRNQIYRTR